MPPKFEVMPSGKSEPEKKETIEEMIEKIRLSSEKVGGVPQIKEVDLFGGKTSDETAPAGKRKKSTGIARAQKNPGPRNERRKWNAPLERMLPPGDR